MCGLACRSTRMLGTKGYNKHLELGGAKRQGQLSKPVLLLNNEITRLLIFFFACLFLYRSLARWLSQ